MSRRVDDSFHPGNDDDKHVQQNIYKIFMNPHIKYRDLNLKIVANKAEEGVTVELSTISTGKRLFETDREAMYARTEIKKKKKKRDKVCFSSGRW